MKIGLLGTGILTAAALLAGSPRAAGQAQQVHVRAWIDGRSELTLQGADVQWTHYDFAAPGRLECDLGSPHEPTTVDSNVWFPVWPDVPTCENRDCEGCVSDVAALISPPLPAQAFQATLVPLQARGALFVGEQPTAANGYRTVIVFDDNPLGGADWYEFDLYAGQCYAEPFCTSTQNSSGFPGHLTAGGDFSIASNNTVLFATQCAASRPGIFFYGPNGANIPLANGRLCIDPFSGLHRIQAVWADASGAASLPLDLGSLPLTPDTLWYFQYWFRDPQGGGTGSNLTDAVRIRFCP
jgi:hypothetical protein